MPEATQSILDYVQLLGGFYIEKILICVEGHVKGTWDGWMCKIVTWKGTDQSGPGREELWHSNSIKLFPTSVISAISSERFCPVLS